MKTLIPCLFSSFLLACGGGSSSSGGSTSGTGTYGGTATARMSAPGVAPQTVSGSLVIAIRPDGTVVSDPGTSFSGTGRLNGNKIVVDVPGSTLSQPGLNCKGAIRMTGTLSGNTINGNMTSMNLNCNGVPITITGTFVVQKTGPARATTSENFGRHLRDAMSVLR